LLVFCNVKGINFILFAHGRIFGLTNSALFG